MSDMKPENSRRFLLTIPETVSKFAPAYLQGRVKFPTGGKVRELAIWEGLRISPDSPSYRKLNRCNYGTDSIVWMEEDRLQCAAARKFTPEARPDCRNCIATY